MTLGHLLELIRAVKNANDKIKEVKFEMWDGGNTRLALRGSVSDGTGFTDYFNATNFEELETILSQMLSL